MRQRDRQTERLSHTHVVIVSPAGYPFTLLRLGCKVQNCPHKTLQVLESVSDCTLTLQTRLSSPFRLSMPRTTRAFVCVDHSLVYFLRRFLLDSLSSFPIPRNALPSPSSLPVSLEDEDEGGGRASARPFLHPNDLIRGELQAKQAAEEAIRMKFSVVLSLWSPSSCRSATPVHWRSIRGHKTSGIASLTRGWEGGPHADQIHGSLVCNSRLALILRSGKSLELFLLT